MRHRYPRTTFAEDLSPQGPIVAFDTALETVRRSTRALSGAIAVDFIRARQAAEVLKDALALAASMTDVMGLPARAEATRQLADVRAVAESILSLAPTKNVGRYGLDVPQAPPSTGEIQSRAMAGRTARSEIAHFRMRLGSLRSALDRLRIAVETSVVEVAASIGSLLALKATDLPHALNDASADVQLIIDGLDTGSASHRRGGQRAQLEAAQKRFREVVARHQLDPEVFTRAENAVCDALAGVMLANVAMMITFAAKSGAFAVEAPEQELGRSSPRALSGPTGEGEA